MPPGRRGPLRGAVTAGAVATGTTSPASTRPPVASTVTTWSSCSVVVASRVPTTQGTPSSRATMAAWQVIPPPSVTRADARLMIGTQSGLVITATSTSPSLSRAPSFGDDRMRTVPETIPGEADCPVRRTVGVLRRRAGLHPLLDRAS